MRHTVLDIIINVPSYHGKLSETVFKLSELAMPLFFIFVFVPLIELMLLIEVGGVIGTAWTFIIIIATALIGTKLVKQQGLATYQQIQTELAQGQMPARSMFDGICILISGILLITPGFITDGIGFLLVTPPFRALAYQQFGSKIKVKTMHSGYQQHSSFEQPPYDRFDDDQTQSERGPKTIEGEYERKE